MSQRPTIEDPLADLLALAGGALIVTGVWAFSWPMGLIVAGGMLIALAFGLARRPVTVPRPGKEP